MHLQDDCPFRLGIPKQRVNSVNFEVAKNRPKFIAYNSNVPWTTAKLLAVL